MLNNYHKQLEESMAIYVTKKTDSKELEGLIIEAWSSGERFVIQRTDGVSAAIVPVEDLKVLEQIDGDFSSSLTTDCSNGS